MSIIDRMLPKPNMTTNATSYAKWISKDRKA